MSTPITWAEIDDIEPDDFTIATVPARFAELGDLHAEIDDVAHRLDTLIDWAERYDIGTDEDAEIIDMDR